MRIRGWVGRIALLLAFWLVESPAAAEWRRAESANFIVYSQGSEASLRQATALLEDYNGFLRLLTGVQDPPPPNKLKVFMVRGRNALKTVRSDVAEDVAGFYTASQTGIAAFVDERSGLEGREQNQILFHEIAHHFMLQYRPTAYPPWYVEGFAEYVMTAQFDKELITYAQPSSIRVSWLVHADWLPLDRVLFQPPPRKPEESALYYAESWLLVHYLLRDGERRAKTIDYLNSTARGEDPRAAFKRVFTVEPKAMQHDIETYAYNKMTYSRLKRRSAAAPPAMTLTALPASADDLLLLDAALGVGLREADVAPTLAKVRAAATGKADDYSRRVLAEAEALYGDGAAADRLLDPLLAAAPTDAQLLYLKGMRHLVAARRDDSAKERKLAQPWFVKAHKADPNQFQTLAHYAESLSGSAQFVSENTSNILLLAHELAPQVSEITMNAAQLLLLRGRFDEAAVLLTPLASSAHQPQLAAAAQQLLRRARAKQADPDLPEVDFPEMPDLPPAKK
jgi:hypothetical protein